MRLTQLAPLPVRRAVWRAVELSVVPPARRKARTGNGPVVIAGMFSTANGIGENARVAYAALKAAGRDPVAFDTSGILGQRDFEWDGQLAPTLPDTRDGLLVIYNNAPEVGRILLYSGRRQRRDWSVASMWAWETRQRPKGWMERGALLDEVWFPSQFVRDAISPPPELPALVAFPPVETAPTTAPTCVDLIPDGPLVFTCYADALSSFERKNPIGAITAFRNAFGETRHVLLVVKTRNAGSSPAAQDLAKAIGNAPNILHLDRALDRAEMAALRARTDILVSLHRSEGFGLTIAEAMRARTPVIATNWSAPSEFLTDDCAALVPAIETTVSDVYGVYREHGHTWAEPDLSAASEAMKRLADDPALRTRLADAASEVSDRLFSPEAYCRAVGL